ncbi:MAG: hypothetical protein R3C44_08020 [Chloroflexota bacterium]
MKISEPRLRALLSQADRNLTNGKLAAAETMYRQILEEAPNAEEAWVGLGNALQDPDKKREAYERALEIAPEMPQAANALAVLDGKPEPYNLDPEPDEVIEEKPLPQTAPAAATTLVVESATPAVQDTDQEFDLVCYRHPDRTTSLRCYNCQKPICMDCAKKTPVGYICPDCLREAEDTFYNNKPTDYIIAALVSFPISLLAGYILVNFRLGFFLYIILFLISGAIGGFIGRITKRAIGYRRGRYLPHLVVAMMILGVLIPALPILLAVLSGNLGALTLLIGPGIYLFVASSAAYWQMR